VVTPHRPPLGFLTNVVTGIRPAMRSRQNVVTPPLGEAAVLTDYGKPVAMVGPLEQTTVEETGSDAGEFRCGFSLTGRSRKRRCARPFASEVRQRLYD
jgi:antitoxin (DNA-binding transcriptional repressor) of toxin-antitoxin stability system